MDKIISVVGLIVEQMKLMEISGHMQVKLLEDQVHICTRAVKLGMAAYISWAPLCNQSGSNQF